MSAAKKRRTPKKPKEPLPNFVAANWSATSKSQLQGIGAKGVIVPGDWAEFPYTGYVFLRKGDIWEIGANGDITPLKDLKGMAYIHHIIEHPNHEYTPEDLSCLMEKSPLEDPANKSAIGDFVEQGMDITTNLDSKSDIGITLDAKGLEAYRKALDQIDSKIAVADDPEEMLALKEQKQEIEKLLRDSDRESKFKTKARAHTNKERDRVKKNMRRALKHLIGHCPAVSTVLNNDTIKTGAKIVYHPDPDNTPAWKTKAD